MAEQKIQWVHNREKNTKSNTYLLQDEDDSYNWAHVKIDILKNKVKTENFKTKKNVKSE